MYKRNKQKTTITIELLIFVISISCMYYALLQTPLKLWEITVVILTAILIILISELLVLYMFKKVSKRKTHS
ncbi:hypothetical protein [Inconstantimicrobium mannanitabidum]|uniref:hypothetical protein n=1 Tax=Inconstantimicrobium mannanitabidum TaxID=1604901 RepID=UPI0021C417B2|nr:hypothetical protein [Clostridium sp. TW13]